MCATAPQAARDIASTIAASQNRVFLNSDSLLLNLVSVIGVNADGQHVSSIVCIVLIENIHHLCLVVSWGVDKFADVQVSAQAEMDVSGGMKK